jgi:protein-L-isoaspartate(D-aspartate) O-methyltransferase
MVSGDGAEAGRSEGAQIAAFILKLRAQGVRHLDLLRAMEQVPRERFAPRRFTDLVRSDVAVPLPHGQTMTAPSTVAQLIDALKPGRGDRALEIGTGSGYVTALMAHMGAEVVSLERFQSLALAAHERIEGLRKVMNLPRIEIRHADGLAVGRMALDATWRFQRVLVNGAVEEMPEGLLSRLEPGGRLVGALKQDGITRLIVITRLPDGSYDRQIGAPIRLPSLTPGVSQAL